MIPDFPPYTSRAARALVILHDRQLREFVYVWRKARAAGVKLPPSVSSSYSSDEALVAHVLGAARLHMYWMTEHLGLPDPEISPLPDLLSDDAINHYVEHLLAQWKLPLAAKSDRELYEYITPDKPCYASAMLEHAVLHPIRHTFQLEELMEISKKVRK